MKLVGERRALAAAIMAFYFLLYGVIAYSQMVPELSKAFGALAGVYGLAFFALVAGYFWARWYAVGVGLYGVITAAVGMWQLGPEPILLMIGGTHLAATVFLWGQAMSEPYDGQSAWRARFHMDDNAVQRLGRSVIRAGVSLPFILLYAFAPKPDAAAAAMSFGVLVLAAAGLRGMLLMRTWGVLALGAAGALLVSIAGAETIAYGLHPAMLPGLAGGFALAASVPFLPSIARFLTAR